MPDLINKNSGILAKITDLAFHWFDLAAYEFLYRLSPARSNKFFNGGYLPLAEDMELLPEFDDEQHSVMMYHLLVKTLVSQLDLNPHQILDVGCGQGGGVRYISTIFPNASIIGVDRNATVVKLAEKNYGDGDKIRFQKSGSQRLNFEPNSFDLVISVGAPTYFGLDNYVGQVAELCKAGGTISLSGGYRQGDHQNIEKELREAASREGLDFHSYHDITPHTFASLKADIPRRIELLKRVPWPFRLYGHKWADLPGSTEYEEYETGRRADFAAVMSKPKN